MNEKLNISLYLLEMFKSKWLEENKEREIDQDKMNEVLEHNTLLYLFNYDSNIKGKFIDIFKKFGTEVNINGYGYDLNKLALIIYKLTGGEVVSGKDLAIINNEVKDNIKTVTITNIKTGRVYKININSNNSSIIIPKKYTTIGLNFLEVDNVKNISIEDNEGLNSLVWDITNKNGGYITDRSKIYMFKDYISKEFIKKWDRENMLVSVVIEDYYEYCDYFNNCFNEYFDDDGDDMF